MNITQQQMKAIKRLINKEDRKAIGMHLTKSDRTVDAVLQCDRVNNEIEEAIVLTAKQNIAHLQGVIADIEAKNAFKVTTEEFRKQKKSALWTTDYTYNRYIDIYLQLTHIKFVEVEELWDYLWNTYKDIISHPCYCIDLFIRLFGLEEKEAIKFFNKKTQEL